MIDWTQVKSLREEVGPDDFEEVVELFLEEVDEVVSRLATNAQTDVLEEDFHFLKGSAMNLGFAEFSSLCQKGEERAARGLAGETDVSEALDAYQKSKVKFINDLPNQIC